jgi:hypothetical protein
MMLPGGAWIWSGIRYRPAANCMQYKRSRLSRTIESEMHTGQDLWYIFGSMGVPAEYAHNSGRITYPNADREITSAVLINQQVRHALRS